MRIILFLLFLSPPQPPLSISLSHWEGGAQIDVRIEPQKENRAVAVSWQNMDSYAGGGTQRELDGENAPLVTSVPLRIEGGHWLVVAVVYSSTGKVLHREEREFFI